MLIVNPVALMNVTTVHLLNSSFYEIHSYHFESSRFKMRKFISSFLDIFEIEKILSGFLQMRQRLLQPNWQIGIFEKYVRRTQEVVIPFERRTYLNPAKMSSKLFSTIFLSRWVKIISSLETFALLIIATTNKLFSMAVVFSKNLVH